MISKTNRNMSGIIFPILFGICMSVGSAYAADKPNIVVIWGDDIGQSNISAYTNGMMGYQTPNIDVRFPHGDEQGRYARCQAGDQRGGPKHRYAA